MATIKRGHDTTALFTPSQASDFLFGYELALLEGWRGDAEVAEIEQLRAVLQSSLGRFDPLVSCHNDLTVSCRNDRQPWY